MQEPGLGITQQCRVVLALLRSVKFKSQPANALKSMVFSEGDEVTGSSETHMLHLNVILSPVFVIKLKICTPGIAVLLCKELGAKRQNSAPIKTCSEYK